MKLHIIALFVAILTASVSFAGGAYAQTTCPTPGGQFKFTGIGNTSKGFPPSIKKKVSAVAILAKRTKCTVELTCVRSSNDEAARQWSREQCVLVRTALRRAPGGSWGSDQVAIRRTKAGGGFSAGTIYITMK